MSTADWTGYFADRATVMLAKHDLRVEVDTNGVRLIYLNRLPECPIGSVLRAVDLCYWLDGFAAAQRHPVAARAAGSVTA